MKREEQDKNWAKHSKEVQQDIIEKYNSYDISVPVLKALKESLEYIFGKHNLQSTLTYEDVIKKLFDKGCYQFADYGKESATIYNKDGNELYFLNFTSPKQAEKLIAIHKLLNVAKFLNKNEDGSVWKPTIEDWDDINQDEFFTLGTDPADNEIHVITVNKMRMSTEIVYFRTKELAEQAVQVLGKDIIRTALTTEY